jgi:hypothetical protein
MEREVREMIEAQLFPGEQILWAGRPRRGLKLRPADWLCLAIEKFIVRQSKCA